MLKWSISVISFLFLNEHQFVNGRGQEPKYAQPLKRYEEYRNLLYSPLLQVIKTEPFFKKEFSFLLCRFWLQRRPHHLLWIFTMCCAWFQSRVGSQYSPRWRMQNRETKQRSMPTKRKIEHTKSIKRNAKRRRPPNKDRNLEEWWNETTKCAQGLDLQRSLLFFGCVASLKTTLEQSYVCYLFPFSALLENTSFQFPLLALSTNVNLWIVAH